MCHVTNNWFANSFLYLWVTCLVRLLPLFLIFSASRSQHSRCGGPRLCSTRQTHMNLALSICVLHQSLCNQFVCSCPRRRCCCCDGSIIESKVCHNACCVCGFTKLLENYLSSIKFSSTNIEESLFALLQALQH